MKCGLIAAGQKVLRNQAVENSVELCKTSFMQVLLPPSEREYIRMGLKRLGLSTLKDYWQSSLWAARKKAFSQTHAYKCRCGARSMLRLHHKTYAHLGRELDYELEWKCDTCHKGEHRRWTKQVRKEQNRVKHFRDSRQKRSWLFW